MNRGKTLLAITVLMVLAAALVGRKVPAADPEAGTDKAVLCASCHGAEGISDYDLWPNLAGQKQKYIEIQLRAYRDGRRKDPWMSPVAKMLSDEDIRDLAAYFSKL